MFSLTYVPNTSLFVSLSNNSVITALWHTGKIPYFQCVVYGGKSKQAPWRSTGPNMTPAMTTAMRAAMEQRASLMEARARAAGQ